MDILKYKLISEVKSSPTSHPGKAATFHSLQSTVSSPSHSIGLDPSMHAEAMGQFHAVNGARLAQAPPQTSGLQSQMSGSNPAVAALLQRQQQGAMNAAQAQKNNMAAQQQLLHNVAAAQQQASQLLRSQGTLSSHTSPQLSSSQLSQMSPQLAASQLPSQPKSQSANLISTLNSNPQFQGMIRMLVAQGVQPVLGK